MLHEHINDRNSNNNTNVYFNELHFSVILSIIIKSTFSFIENTLRHILTRFHIFINTRNTQLELLTSKDCESLLHDTTSAEIQMELM